MSEAPKSPPKKPVRQAIVDNFIDQLKSGASFIGRPTASGEVPPPINAVTGKAYSGINRLILSEAADDPRWLTKRQAEAQGYQVKEAAEARPLIFWEYSREVPTYNQDGSPRLNNIGNQIVERVKLDRPMMRAFSAYHVRDLETSEGQGWPPYEAAPDNDPLERTSAILAGSEATIRHDPSPNAANYKVNYDLIILPDKSLVSEEEYCAQAVKELTAWTGHPDRLGWLKSLATGEARVQADIQETMAGAMIAQDLGLKFEPNLNERAIDVWVKILEKDPDMLFRAATQAENIRSYIMGLERKHTRDMEEDRSREYSAQGFRPAGPEDKPELGAWIRAEGEEATVFAVVAERDGSIVSSFGDLESCLTESRALNTGVRPPLKYSGDTIILDVPFEEKDMVKTLGATWDQKNKAWCARPGVELNKLGCWLPANELNRVDLVEPDISDRLTLDVPYKFRQDAKDLGAFFDAAKGAWVTSSKNINLDELTRRFPPKAELEAAPVQAAEVAAVPEITEERVVLAVPFEEKNLAKGLGAKWDRDEKVWYAEPGTDLAKLSQWIPEKEPEPEKVLAAAEEFAKVLEEAGFQLDGPPKMDGKIYRVPLQDGPPNNNSGAYYATTKDERPNGWLKNHQSGEYQAWMYSGQEMSAGDKEAQKEQAANKRLAMEDKAEKISTAKWSEGIDVAQEFAAQVDGLTPTSELLKNPFLEVSGINAVGGVRRDDDGKLMIPGVNIEGRLQNVQTIGPNGEAFFEKGANRVGVMCVIDGFEVISSKNEENGLPVFREKYTDHGDENLNDDILIAEDFATGASLHMATGLPTLVAFSPDNLLKTASVIHKKYPEANLLVCANNHPERYSNLCLKKAEEAAIKVGGKLLVPEFNKVEQEAGMATFNDMHKNLGLDAVKKAIDEARGMGAVKDKNAGLSR